MGDRFENLLSFLKMTAVPLPPPPTPQHTGKKRPVPDRAQSYIFCSKIMTEYVNAMFPLLFHYYIMTNYLPTLPSKQKTGTK